MPEPSTVEPKQCQRQFPCPSCRCILDAGHTGRCDEHCGQPPLRDLGERPIDLDLSHAATPSGPFLQLVADKRVQLTAQAALGRLLTGDTERASALLSELDTEALGRVYRAASELLALAVDIQRHRTEAARGQSANNFQSSGVAGAASELIASAELMRLGWHVYRCQAPHAPFDLVAYRDGRCIRVEVKSASRADMRYAPTFQAPGNNDWDLLVVVGPDHGVFMFWAADWDLRAARAAIRAHYGFAPLPEPVRPACGTTRGYDRHRRQKEPPCEPCRTAMREYGRNRRARASSVDAPGAEDPDAGTGTPDRVQTA